MPKKTNQPKRAPDTPTESIKKSNTWEVDQAEHRYYYDDAHGYEKYDAALDHDDETECDVPPT